ncbi:butyrophilin subfamily 1 member A1-like [Motacilla alba alba]|uniref:butyrophilin subfamily 1 member A1-like n=1 Tax=Motacilla alba alba TaxID=1094192 RepID=UPI0018D4F6F3|nr:butyrophilin subfamily 1 member A1-like [Motacilla alba alba]
MLPCSFSPEQHAQDTEVTWFWEQLSPFVHGCKGGQDQYGEQMLQYRGHTELLKDSPAQGSTHLKICHVQLSDRRNYTCFVQHGLDYIEAVVESKVTGLYFVSLVPLMYLLAASALFPCPPARSSLRWLQSLSLSGRETAKPPHPPVSRTPQAHLGLSGPAASGSALYITLEHYEAGGIWVSCSSASWYPQPLVLWQDSMGGCSHPTGKTLPWMTTGSAEESSIILSRGVTQPFSVSIR